MKRKLFVALILLMFFSVSCSSLRRDKNNKEVPVQKNAGQQGEITNSELLDLVYNFTFPTGSADDISFDEECPGLPIELINQIKKALYCGDSDSLILELNDKSLMITAKDFVFKPNMNDDIDFYEEKLNDLMQNTVSDCLIYKCDIDGDGTDEIIVIENLKYEYSYSNRLFVLKKFDDKYVYAGSDYLGYYRSFAICKNNGKFYLAANYDDYKTKTTKAVGLFGLTCGDSGFVSLYDCPYTYIAKMGDDYRYNLLYKNQNAPIVGKVEDYVKDIATDLVYTDRTHKTFYGDEIQRNDLFDEARDNNSDTTLWNINAIDVNNDGKDEFYERKILYNGGSDYTETEVNWYNPETKSLEPALFTSWSSVYYYLTQKWFKIIDGKIVIFSFYRKKSKDIYLLDVRICENGKTTILLDYLIDLQFHLKLSDNWDYYDTNFVKIDYTDPDVEKAFPKDVDDIIEHFAAKVQGDFKTVNYEDNNVPNSLIVRLEEALFNRSFDKLNFNYASFEINAGEFYGKFEQDIIYSREYYDRYVSHVYKYNLDKDDYYLLVADSGGSARFVDIIIYRESKGELKYIDSLISLDLHAAVIEHNNDLFLIERSYNYYSKYIDTINVYKLVPDKITEFVSIQLEPKEFEWHQVFNNYHLYEKSINSYISEIKEELMAKSPINDDIQIFIGDETDKFDRDKKLRLKSVSGNHDFFEIDFNNDGEPEYFERHYWFPSGYTVLSLLSDFYKFTDKRLISINSDFNRDDSMLIQLWFKEIDGKVFTFRLFLKDGYNYYLNVSLVENTNVTQVQSYIIVPKCEFNINRWEK
ncbi:MAG: hypothetical protein GX383_07930 [Clostridium sp.]|nr:hypothetical protein [Clostridium sp.]